MNSADLDKIYHKYVDRIEDNAVKEYLKKFDMESIFWQQDRLDTFIEYVVPKLSTKDALNIIQNKRKFSFDLDFDYPLPDKFYNSIKESFKGEFVVSLLIDDIIKENHEKNQKSFMTDVDLRTRYDEIKDLNNLPSFAHLTPDNKEMVMKKFEERVAKNQKESNKQNDTFTLTL